MNIAELEIVLSLSDQGEYLVAMRFRTSVDQDEGPIAAEIDFTKLNDAWTKDNTGEAYARLLTDQLFASDKLSKFLDRARIAAKAGNTSLRVRLRIMPSAKRLEDLRWELLLDPNNQYKPLAHSRSTPFSRYLTSDNWQTVSLRPRADLRALVAVANPKDLGQWEKDLKPLAAEEVEDELKWIEAALPGVPVDRVAGPNTLAQMAERLAGEEYDFIVLVCHGDRNRGTDEPVLLLENERGEVKRTVAEPLVRLLTDVAHPPRLVVLTACHGAGKGPEAQVGEAKGVFTAIGPKLAVEGIPAVLAFQGRVTVKTVRLFLEAFFKVLLQDKECDGQVDWAASVARGACAAAGRHDHWVPALFTRISQGRIWSVSGMGWGREKPFDGWDGLVQAIHKGECTPVLGPGLLESLLGPTREFARRWARQAKFPLALYQQEDLARVAQFIAVIQGEDFPFDELGNRLREEVDRRWRPKPAAGAEDKPPDLTPWTEEDLEKDPAKKGEAEKLGKDAATKLVGRTLFEASFRQLTRGRAEPHAILARLPFPLYLTTNPDTLLEHSLRHAGKPFDFDLCRWRETTDAGWPPSPFSDPGYRPQAKRPLVYHLYGRLDCRDKLVLTEDNYFDYLIAVSRGGTTGIPNAIGATFSRNAVLFLGFRIEEWDFRALYRQIMGLVPGSRFTTRFRNVAVQIEPQEGRNADPDEARSYLKRYFGNASIDVIPGSVEDFTRELCERWNAKYPAEAIQVKP